MANFRAKRLKKLTFGGVIFDIILLELLVAPFLLSVAPFAFKSHLQMTRRAGSFFSLKSNAGAGTIWLHTGAGHNGSLEREK